MIKKLYSLFLLLIFSLVQTVTAQQSSCFQLNAIENNRLSFSYVTPSIQAQNIKYGKDIYTKVIIDEHHSSTIVGAPELPVFTNLVEIPLCDEVEIQILYSEFDIVDAATLGILHTLSPAQPSLSKSEEMGSWIKNDSIYKTNAFYSEPLVHAEKTGIMRNTNLATIYISPVQYNPVTHQLKIYRNIHFVVKYRNANMPATYEMKNLHANEMFAGVKAVITNTIPVKSKSFTYPSPIRYLIVAHDAFKGELDSFVQWKKRKGFLVDVVYTDDPEVGNTSATIQAFLKAQYTHATLENPAPTYVLLVGDVQQIPVSARNTDLYYFTWSEGDYIPDCYYGRFSAQTVEQLRATIEKSLMHEQYTFPDPSFLNNALLIAGYDNANYGTLHGNGQVNYFSRYYINTDYGYQNVYKYMSSPSVIGEMYNIHNQISEGVGFANFTAHCSATGWRNPDFSVNHVANITNINKFGLMIGSCCQSGSFQANECLGEALVRTPQKGALAYIGASEDTYWNEDYHWTVGVRSNITTDPEYNPAKLGAYDRLFHTHNEPYEMWSTTLGAIIAAGNLSVQNSSSFKKQTYWEIYNLIGDPSIMPYLTVPKNITATFPSTAMAGSTSLHIATVPHAYVALTYQGSLIGAAFSDETGVAQLTFPPLAMAGEYEIAISAQHYTQYFKNLTIIAPEGALVIAEEVTTDSSPEIGSNLSWNITLNNVGVDTALNTYIKIDNHSPYLTISNDSIFVGTLSVDETILLEECFTTKLDSFFKDQTVLYFSITVYCNDTIYSQREVTFKGLAPQYTRKGYIIEEYIGNQNGIAESGEILKFTVTDMNSGHLDANDANAALISQYTKAPMLHDYNYIGYFPKNTTMESVFYVRINDDIPVGTFVPLYYRIRSGEFVVNDTLYFVVGGEIEDFETGNFNKYPWINTSAKPWEVVSLNQYEGLYTAKSPTGIFDNEFSRLSITLDVLFDDEISFFCKLASEEEYDLFNFYIDDELMATKSGYTIWEKVSVPVSSGVHSFIFEYAKDMSFAYGSDCVWLDYIKLPGKGTMAPSDTVVEFPSGIEPVQHVPIVKLYPNPANEWIRISAEEHIKQVDIIDLHGRVIMSKSDLAGSSTQINTSALAKGFYLVNIHFYNKSNSIKKLIKQ